MKPQRGIASNSIGAHTERGARGRTGAAGGAALPSRAAAAEPPLVPAAPGRALGAGARPPSAPAVSALGRPAPSAAPGTLPPTASDAAAPGARLVALRGPGAARARSGSSAGAWPPSTCTLSRLRAVRGSWPGSQAAPGQTASHVAAAVRRPWCHRSWCTCGPRARRTLTSQPGKPRIGP